MNTLRFSVLSAVALVLGAAGCGGSVDASAFGGGDDAATGTDTGSSDDSTSGDTGGGGPDSSTGVDTGTGADTGTGVDTGTSPDTGSSFDTGSFDTGLPPDDTGFPDTGFPPPFDTGVPPPDTGTDAATTPCSALGKPYNGHCYFVLKPRTYAESQAVCKSYGGYLVAITTDGEQGFVATLYPSVENWIGLSREGTGSGYTKWINGEALGFTSWAPGEPNYSGSCVRMLAGGSTSGSKWADQSCTNVINALCERDYL